MSTTVERFPTYRDPDTGLGFGIPIHPEPSILETTVATTSTGVVDHVEIEKIMARPTWSFEEAMARFSREAWLKEVDAQTEETEPAAKKVPAKKAPAKKSTAKKPPAKKKPR